MLAMEIYNFIISNKLVTSVFIIITTIVMTLIFTQRFMIISGIIGVESIILFITGYLPMWLFVLVIIMIGGEIYANQSHRFGGLILNE